MHVQTEFMENCLVKHFIDETIWLWKNVLPIIRVADIPLVQIKLFHKLYIY